MYRLKELIKKEYSLLISREGGSIVFEASNSLYLLVPKAVREKLERDFKIDLRHNREGIMVKCDLMLEPQGTVNLVYSFWKKEKGCERL